MPLVEFHTQFSIEACLPMEIYGMPSVPALLCFLMGRMFPAETAVLNKFEPFGIVFLVLHRIVIALLALGAGECDFRPHNLLYLLSNCKRATKKGSIGPFFDCISA